MLPPFLIDAHRSPWASSAVTCSQHFPARSWTGCSLQPSWRMLRFASLSLRSSSASLIAMITGRSSLPSGVCPGIPNRAGAGRPHRAGSGGRSVRLRVPAGFGAAGEGWAVAVFREAKKHWALYGAPLSLPNVQRTSPYLGQFRDIRLSDKCWGSSASITQPQAQPLPQTPQARAGSALPEPFPHSSPTP